SQSNRSMSFARKAHTPSALGSRGHYTAAVLTVKVAARRRAASDALAPRQRVDRSAEQPLDAAHLLPPRVSLTRPEESAEPVLSPPRDDVDVQVRHALADPVVDRDERSLGLETRLHRARQELHVEEERPDQRVGKIGQRCQMVPWHQEAVAAK